MSKFRQFDVTTIEGEDKKRVHGFKITCGRCGKVHKISVNRLAGGASSDSHDREEAKFATRKFENAGWFVGHRSIDDRCPEHKAAAGAIAEQLKNKDIMPATKPAPVLQEHADAPPVMSREDKRLIFSQLHEVYLDENRGYADDWTDKKVAEHLGVPRAWVEKVRADDFGPVKSNDEIERHLKAVKDAIADAHAVIREAGEVKAAAELAISRANAAVAKTATLSILIHTLEGRLRDVQSSLR